MAIGSKLKARREEIRLPVQKLAAAVGLKRQTIYDLEAGRQASSTKLHLICQVLGLNPDWVEFGRGPRLAPSKSPIDGAPTDSVVSAAQESRTREVPMTGAVARDVVEMSMMLAALSDTDRHAVATIIRSLMNRGGDQELGEITPPPPKNTLNKR